MAASCSPDATLSTVDGVAVNRHEVYYLHDGVIFLVENVLFKIPRHMLVLHSPFFKSLFSLPSGSSIPQGTTDCDPISIRQVKSLEFERLLALLYPLTLAYTSFTEKWETVEWLSILRLATMWEIAEARSLAIQYLSKVLGPIEKITFGRQYHWLAWVKDGFTMLCLRPEYLPIDMARQLDIGDLLNYGVVREKIRSRLMKPVDRNSNGVWTNFRHGATYARIGGYEDGMVYCNDPLVKELIEDYFTEKTLGD